MPNRLNIWNGYTVYGDAEELDLMAVEDGMVNLDNEDIIRVLSDGGESYVTTGVSANISEAFRESVDNLPCKIDKVNKMLVNFRCGVKTPAVTDITAISRTITEPGPGLSCAWV